MDSNDLKPYVPLSKRDSNWLEKLRIERRGHDILGFYVLCYFFAFWQLMVGIISGPFQIYLLDSLIYLLMGVLTQLTLSRVISLLVTAYAIYHVSGLILLKLVPLPNDPVFSKGDIDNYWVPVIIFLVFAIRASWAKFKLYKKLKNKTISINLKS